MFLILFFLGLIACGVLIIVKLFSNDDNKPLTRRTVVPSEYTESDKIFSMFYVPHRYYNHVNNIEIDHELKDFIVFDFETANKYRSSACAIGIVVVENLQIVESYEYLIKPPYDFFEFTHIHGISWQQVCNEDSFGIIWQKIEHLFLKYPAIAYNLPFDLSVLNQTLDLHHIERPVITATCALAAARFTIKGLDSYKLSNVCEHLDIDINHHNALSDATATANLVLHMVDLEKQLHDELVEKQKLKEARKIRAEHFAKLNSDSDMAAKIEAIARKIRKQNIKVRNSPDDELLKARLLELHNEYVEVTGYTYNSTKF